MRVRVRDRVRVRIRDAVRVRAIRLRLRLGGTVEAAGEGARLREHPDAQRDVPVREHGHLEI